VIYSLPFFVSGCWRRREFWKFRKYQIANKILDIFCISILFSECFGKNLRRKWIVEKKVYIHYMLQACEVMHVIGGPLQRNAVLTFSSCLELDWSYLLLSFHCWNRASHLLNEKNWKWLCWKCYSLSGCVSVFCVTMGNILEVYFSDTFWFACQDLHLFLYVLSLVVHCRNSKFYNNTVKVLHFGAASRI